MERLIWMLALGGAILFAYWATLQPAKTSRPPQTTESPTPAAAPVAVIKPPPAAASAPLVPESDYIPEPAKVSLGDTGRGPEYYPSLDYALQRARQDRKPIIVVVTPRHCPRTDAFATLCDTYPVRPYYERCVWAYIDMEDNDKMINLIRRCRAMQEPSKTPIVLSFTSEGVYQGKCAAPDALTFGRYLEQVAGK